LSSYLTVPLGKLVGLNDGAAPVGGPSGAVCPPNGILNSPALIWSLVRTIVGDAVGLVDGTLDLDGRPDGALMVFSRIFF
jgi:hypothetical protein